MSDNKSDIRLIQLNSYVRPKLVENKVRKWVLNGKNNSFYQYIIDRFNGSPTNSAIITTFIDLIYGRGLDGENIDVLNEVLEDVDLRKIIADFYLFGEASIQVVKKRNKKELPQLKHIAKNHLAPAVENEDGEIEGYWYCKDWSNQYKNKPVFIPSFGTSSENIEIFNIKPYKAGKNYFTDPEYLAGLPYAEIEEEIANFCVNHIKNGLSFGYIVNIPDGANWKPEDREKFERQLKSKLTGSNNAGKFVLSFNGRDTEVTVTPLEVNSAHKQWEFLVEEARQQLITAHRVTSPMLFGIKDNTGLGNNADELDTAEKQLYKRVIAPKQKYITDALETISKAYGKEIDLEFLPLTDYEEFEEATEEPKEKVIDDKVEMSICCSEHNINKVIDSVADSFIQMGEDVNEDEYELINEDVETSFELTESKLNNIIKLSSPPIKSLWNKKSKQDTSIFLIRYKYAGNKNPQREFCQKVMNADKVYRYEDLEKASTMVVNKGFGLKGADTYNIALYKGGVNCKHWWQRKIYLKKGNKSISVNKARKMILELEPKDRPNAKWKENPKEVAQIASESNNFWRANFKKVLKLAGFNPNQSRDEKGRWANTFEFKESDDFFKNKAIKDWNKENDRLDKLLESDSIHVEDYENLRKKNMVNKLQDFFGGKYTEVYINSEHFVELRISDHPQSSNKGWSHFSFIIDDFGANDTTLNSYDSIEENIKYIKEYIKKNWRNYVDE